MKMEFKIPKKFCHKHGCAMNLCGTSIAYNETSGAVEDLRQRYKCPRWFCGETSGEWLVLSGKVMAEKEGEK